MNFNRSKGISEIIAIILVVVLTLVAFGVAYAFVFSTLGRSSSGKSVNIQGEISSGAANVVLNIYNTGSVTVTGVSASLTGSCTWTLNPSSISPGASGVDTGASCSSLPSVGTTDIATVVITFSSGTLTQIVPLVVQS